MCLPAGVIRRFYCVRSASGSRSIRSRVTRRRLISVMTPRPPRCNTIKHVLNDLFPGAGDLSRAQYWCGLRPMTPDNPPVLGTTIYKNLFLNTGHGTLGWTMACGSGKVIADLVSGRQPEIDLDGLTLARVSWSPA